MTQQSEQYDIQYIRDMCQKPATGKSGARLMKSGPMNYNHPERLSKQPGWCAPKNVLAGDSPTRTAAAPRRRHAASLQPDSLMIADGGDVEAGVSTAADDAITMPLQSGTQWTPWRTSSLKRRCGTTVAPATSPAGRPQEQHHQPEGEEHQPGRSAGHSALPRQILLEAVRRCTRKTSSALRRRKASPLLVAISCSSDRSDGRGEGARQLVVSTLVVLPRALSILCAEWVHDTEIAGYATDTWGTEVIPNETKAVFQPLHVFLYRMWGS